MINICHQIDLRLSHDLIFSNVHAHLLIDESLDLITLKLYLGNDFDPKVNQLLAGFIGNQTTLNSPKKLQ
jgi:hypothetical protein